MRRITRDHLFLRCTALAAALIVVVSVCVLAVGGVSGTLFAIAIGTAVAVAALSDTDRRHGCSLPFARRRD
jgi:hypothetical protein